MSTVRSRAASLRALRTQSLWRLLAADKAPTVIAALQAVLGEEENALTASVLVERLSRALEDLRASGEDLPQSAQAYVADWLASGWVVRRLRQGASEEEYELSVEAAQGIRFLSSLMERRVVTTESRLATVMNELVRLAEDTDPDPETKIQALLSERSRIDAQIESIRTGGLTILEDDRALERAREIIALADELAADFRRVRDDFHVLNRDFRQTLMENEGSRGHVLEELFAGVDVIAESDAGKTFNAFWRLLTNAQQSATFREAIEAVSSRAFARKLKHSERRFLINLTALLIDEGSRVHDVLQSFARSLRGFVQSREFQEQRRLHSLLRQATQAALSLRELVSPTASLNYQLLLTSSRLRSVSQTNLYDPAEHVADSTIHALAVPELDLETVSELVRQSEIDFRTLRHNLRVLLRQFPRVTIAEVLEHFPAEQGLGSVVGYVALGAKHGELSTQSELVAWHGRDQTRRQARVPAIYFLRGCSRELEDE